LRHERAMPLLTNQSRTRSLRTRSADQPL
jgi:hypothetical protein